MKTTQQYRALARRAARRHGLDATLFERQIAAESAFDPDARSRAGALGIAQIMPGTASDWKVDPMDPEQALEAAARHMARYAKKYGGYRNALVAYNAGPGRVGKPLYPETRRYIATIMGDAGADGPVPVQPSTSIRTVRQQQEAVNGLGRAPRLRVDGLWGPKTEAGVKWLQNRVGTRADGRWGSDTEARYLAAS